MYRIYREILNSDEGEFEILCLISGILHTCDKFQKGIREIFLSFQGELSKMYRIYRGPVKRICV